jgi:anti-sigma B factor antagonist
MPDFPPSLQAGLEPFRVEVHPEHDTVRLAPVGELDIATVDEIGDRLRELCEHGFRRFLLDLRRLTFMDSSGLRLILDWDGRARRDGISFAVIPGPAVVQRVFEVAGVLDRLPFQAR